MSLYESKPLNPLNEFISIRGFHVKPQQNGGLDIAFLFAAGGPKGLFL